ncbi:MAG: tyrosine--tRNA ligase [bacterium]
MKFSIHSDVLNIFPDTLCGIVVFTGINNRIASKDPYGLLKQAILEKQKEADLLNRPELSAWEEHFRKASIDPKKYPPSIVAISQRIMDGKGMPSINAVVDLYNSVSIQHLVPMGGYDLDRVKDDIEIRLSHSDDIFIPLGADTAEEIDVGQVSLATGNKIMCARFAWRQDNNHKVLENTKNLLLRIEGAGLDKEALHDFMHDISELIKKYCGGKYQNFLLSKDTPSVDLSLALKNVQTQKLSKEDIMIEEIINKGTVDVIMRDELEAKLRSGKKLRIKLGIDPTGSDLHLGHMVPVKKLREFQKLGHQIQLLFGNFTGQIGDPTGKSQVRTNKTQKELEANANTYIEQVSKVLDTNKIDVVWNADWLAPLTFADVVQLAGKFTVSQMLERDMFQDRIKKEQPIYVHEFMYPLMQGYDSVALKSDVEIGGTDQTFNLLAGRTLQKAYGQASQSVVTVPILEGLDGHIKMGKSENNYIGVVEAANEQYGKIMSIPDTSILRYFELATELSLEDIDAIRSSLSEGLNPRDAKMQLAREIVTLYHSIDAAKEAEESFKKVFQRKEIPDDMLEYTLSSPQNIIDLIIENKLVSSRSDVRRMLDQNAVSFNDEKITDIEYMVSESGVLRVGKRRFLRIL